MISQRVVAHNVSHDGAFRVPCVYNELVQVALLP